MCGIVGAIAKYNVVPVLLEGLKRLEYRGYDSAGLAVIKDTNLQRLRSVGKVDSLIKLSDETAINSNTGIAHTRWATHGVPSEKNAHPHVSREKIAIVHNGIIENHTQLRHKLENLGYEFTSETDTEVIVHLLASHIDAGSDLKTAVIKARDELIGAYGLAAIHLQEPEKIIVTRSGSPLVIGLSENGNFIASDVFALLPVTNQFKFLEEGDLAEITLHGVAIYYSENKAVER